MPIDRFVRQADLVPRSRLSERTLTVVGLGAIGRPVALGLAALGATRLQLVDFDLVEETNLTTQGYAAAELGRLKVEATAAAIAAIDPTILVERVADRWRPSLVTGHALFCCVDSITARAALWRNAGSSAAFWADGRMLGEVIRVLTATAERGRTHYPTTLFAAAEAEPGRCTARGTLYTAQLAAGLMLHQFARWLRGLPTDPDLTLNLLASELSLIEGR